MPYVGTARISLTATGELLVDYRPITGAALLTLTASGQLAAPAIIAGSAPLVLTANGHFVTSGVVAGSAKLVLQANGQFRSPAPVQGSARISLTAQGRLESTVKLTGSALLTLQASGSVTIPVNVSGAASIHLTAQGRVETVAEIIASAVSAYLINTKTAGHATYDNFNFNSFFKLGSDYYGCSSEGIFKLDAILDKPWSVKTGVTTFGKREKKYVHDTYVETRAAADFELSETIDEQIVRSNAVVYDDSRQGLHTRRVKLPKGLSGTAWQFELSGSGGDVEIKVLDVEAIVSQRS